MMNINIINISRYSAIYYICSSDSYANMQLIDINQRPIYARYRHRQQKKKNPSQIIITTLTFNFFS